MDIKMAGIDHSKASIDLREKFSFTKKKRIQAMRQIRETYGVEGCVLIATCNRTEIWISGPAPTDPFSMLCFAAEVSLAEYRKYFTERAGAAAVRHLFELSCGMKSLVFAEDQILAQVKEALADSRVAGCTDALLEKLFSSAVCAAKKVKTEVRFSTAEPSMARSAVEKVLHHFASPANTKCLVVGNGKMGRLAAAMLCEKGFTVCVTVRQYTKGEVVIPAGCEAVMYEDRKDCLKNADVLISATSSPHYTFHADEFVQDGKKRVVIDLAVPRDIDPAIADFPGTSLYDVDDLGAEQFREHEAVKHAREILDGAIEKLEAWYYFRGMSEEIGQISKITADDMAARAAYALSCEGMEPEDADLFLQSVKRAARNAVSSLIYGLKDVDRQTADDCIHAFRKTAEKNRGL